MNMAVHYFLRYHKNTNICMHKNFLQIINNRQKKQRWFIFHFLVSFPASPFPLVAFPFSRHPVVSPSLFSLAIPLSATLGTPALSSFEHCATRDLVPGAVLSVWLLPPTRFHTSQMFHRGHSCSLWTLQRIRNALLKTQVALRSYISMILVWKRNTSVFRGVCTRITR